VREAPSSTIFLNKQEHGPFATMSFKRSLCDHVGHIPLRTRRIHELLQTESHGSIHQLDNIDNLLPYQLPKVQHEAALARFTGLF
jgi:hypothetical protein